MAQEHDYRVIPAPTRGEKAKGVKGAAEQFAHALTQTMNRMAAEGWEYLRAEKLPCEERDGWFGRKTTERHMLVFRRPVAGTAAGAAPSAAASAAPGSGFGAAFGGAFGGALAGGSAGVALGEAAAPLPAPQPTAGEGAGAEPGRTAGGAQALEWARRRSAEPPLVAPRLTRPAPGGSSPGNPGPAGPRGQS